MVAKESPNPWSCAAMGEVVSIALTVIVSKLTQQVPDEHIDKLFAPPELMILSYFSRIALYP